MAKLLEELKNECLISTLSYANLFQKAYFVAQKLDQKEMVDFLKKGIDGYKKQKDIPDYRYINVTYKANNPIRGWIPVTIPSNSSLIKYLHYPIFQSVGELESIVTSKGDALVMSIPVELQELFISKMIVKFPFEISACFSKNQIKTILEIEKRMILDWVLDLERKEILGDKCHFTGQEKDIANNMTIININAPINGANIIGNMTNSFVTINNNGKIDFESLKQIVEQIKNELEKAQAADSNNVVALKEKVEKLELSIVNRDENSIIDILKNIATGAVSSGIWSVGTTVSSYISSIMG